MGKFKVHLKLQGLELDIEGDRSDMPAINNAVAREITGLEPTPAVSGLMPATPLVPATESAAAAGLRESAASTPKTIEVHIDRLEVRTAPAPSTPPPPTPRAGSEGFESYARARRGMGRSWY